MPKPLSYCSKGRSDGDVVDITLLTGLIFRVKEDIDESYAQTHWQSWVGRLEAQQDRDMLRAAAHAYAAHPNRRGCFILEHAKAGATESGIAAKQIAGENRAKVMAFLQASGISADSHVVDYVSVTMLGLSAAAKEGWEEERLNAVVETAVVGLCQIIGNARDIPEESS